MAHPSESQLAFVADMEAGVRAVKAQESKVTKISQVAEAAGREPAELPLYVGRFLEQGHYELIQRLSDAFAAVDIKPLCITRALEAMPKRSEDEKALPFDSEPLELVRELPALRPEPKAAEPVFAIAEQPQPEEMLADVIRMINRLPLPLERKKVAGMTASWFGVGG